jgi:hypothetical protein
MKNRIICILFAVLLCAALCACGGGRMDNDNRTDDMDILPEGSPMVSPDPADGYVNDHDGIIGNGGTDRGSETGDGGMIPVSPSPSAESGPSQPMPSASPSNSPKP